MAELSTVLAVLGLFMLRIGVPVVVLVTLGVLIDRWQTRREAEVRNMYATGQIEDEVQAESEDEAKKHKVA